MITLEGCRHRFCSECTVEQLKSWVNARQVEALPCFDFECSEPIGSSQI